MACEITNCVNSTNRARASLPGVGSADSQTLRFPEILCIPAKMCTGLEHKRFFVGGLERTKSEANEQWSVKSEQKS